MSKITKTILDPAQEVSRTSYSSEQEQPLYFNKDGERISMVEVEENYKPEYDFETKNIKHWWYRTESKLFRDVHHVVKTFRSRTAVGKYLKALYWTLLDKYLLRHFS